MAPLTALAGGFFVLYALSKGYLTTEIVATGWQFAGLSPEQTALLVHLFEGVPILVMTLGLASLHVRAEVDGWLSTVGVFVALAGFGLTIVSHVGEHVLDPVTVPALTGGENWLVWGYYLSWMTVYAGLATYGVALGRSGNTPRWLHRLLVVSLPTVVLVGLAVVVADLFTLAGTFRMYQGVTWILIGGWLWDGSPIR